MHTLTMTFTSTQDLLDFAAKHLTTDITTTGPTGINSIVLVDSNNPSISELVKEKAPRKTKVQVEEAKPEAAPVPTPVANNASDTPDRKSEVRPQVMALLKADRAALLKLFDEYGVTNLDEVEDKHLAAFLSSVNAQLASKE